MPKKILIATIAFVLCMGISFVVVWAARSSEVGLPQAITASSLCPVASCAADECHAADQAPQPDGTFEMLCPRVEDCASAQCHAWTALTSRYNTPDDWSMNLWILAPVLLVIALVFIVKKI